MLTINYIGVNMVFEFFLKCFHDDSNRITSYNVCYTKLLRDTDTVR